MILIRRRLPGVENNAHQEIFPTSCSIEMASLISVYSNCMREARQPSKRSIRNLATHVDEGMSDIAIAMVLAEHLFRRLILLDKKCQWMTE